MSLDQLDASLRIGAVTTILLLAALLFRERSRVGTPAWLLLPLAVCLSGFLIGNTPSASLRPSGVPGTIANVASGFAVVFLWWFCLACFDGRFRLRGGVLAVGVLWAAIAAVDRGLLGAALADVGLSHLLVLLGFGIVGHLVWRLAAERKGDLIQKRHDARIMVAVLLGGQLLIDLSADVMFGFAWRPRAFAMAQNGAILGFGLWLAATTLSVRPAALTFGDLRKLSPTPARMDDDDGDATADAPLRRRLSALIDDERIFLDPELTFAGLVARMEASERTVRRLINHDLGFDHFRTFLNHYRTAEACRLLADPTRSGDKLIAIALDSGFASLASFNRVFRAVAGCTPTDYREARRSVETGKSPQVPGFEERSAVF